MLNGMAAFMLPLTGGEDDVSVFSQTVFARHLLFSGADER